MLGGRVIKTVGSKITHLTPSLGFSAEMAAASTVVAATYIGFPISTTDCCITTDATTTVTTTTTMR